MPGTTRQGNALTDTQDGDWIGNLLSPEDPSYNYGSVLPIRERKGDDPQNPSLELAWPSMARELALGTKNLILGAGGEKAPLSDTSDAMSLATGGRLTNTSEAPLLALAGRGLGTKGDPNELGIFAGRKATGYRDLLYNDKFLGVDNQPKFEINDFGSKLQMPSFGRGQFQLGDVLDHPELYKQYPDLKKFPVVYSENMNPKFGGAVQETIDGPKIFLNVKQRNGLPATDEDLHSVLLHEIQHVVQQKEGFALGGNPEGTARALEIQAQALRLKAHNVMDSGGLFGEKQQAYADLDAASNLQRYARQYPFHAYESLAGEVEARNVQSRHAAQLRVARRFDDEGVPYENIKIAASPLETMEYPAEHQLILPNESSKWSGGAQSASQPTDADFNVKAYHGTLSGDIGEFHEGTHFGTASAASQRIQDLLHAHTPESLPYGVPSDPDKQAPTVYPVSLRVKKAFDMPDYGDFHDSEIASSMHKQGLIDDHELEQIHEGDVGAVEKLKELGYNAIRYENRFEDSGSISHMMFDPKDVKVGHSVNHDPFKAPSPSNPHPVDYDPFKESK